MTRETLLSIDFHVNELVRLVSELEENRRRLRELEAARASGELEPAGPGRVGVNSYGDSPDV